MKTLSELPQDPKERVNQLRNEWQTWTDQAVYALIQGQTENEFIAHCHPDNRPAALKAWRQVERLGAKVIGAYRHMEACRALLNVPNDEVLYAEIEKLLEFAQMVGRSACLDQRTGDECRCFSCKARELLSQVSSSVQSAGRSAD